MNRHYSFILMKIYDHTLRTTLELNSRYVTLEVRQVVNFILSTPLYIDLKILIINIYL